MERKGMQGEDRGREGEQNGEGKVNLAPRSFLKVGDYDSNWKFARHIKQGRI